MLIGIRSVNKFYIYIEFDNTTFILFSAGSISKDCRSPINLWKSFSLKKQLEESKARDVINKKLPDVRTLSQMSLPLPLPPSPKL